MTLTLADAKTIVDVAIAMARQRHLNVSVAVCDDQGRLIALNRMDGAYAEVNRFAIGKAVVSAGTGLPSGEVTGTVEHSPVDVVIGEGVPAIRVRGDCRSSGAAGSKAPAASPAPRRTSRMKIALVPGSPPLPADAPIARVARPGGRRRRKPHAPQ